MYNVVHYIIVMQIIVHYVTYFGSPIISLWSYFSKVKHTPFTPYA